MDKIIFLKVKGFVRAFSMAKREDRCEDCLEEFKERAKSLGLDEDSFKGSCEEECEGISDKPLENAVTENILIKLDEIVSITEEETGGVVIQTTGDIMPRLFEDDIKDIMKRIDDYITII